MDRKYSNIEVKNNPIIHIITNKCKDKLIKIVPIEAWINGIRLQVW